MRYVVFILVIIMLSLSSCSIKNELAPISITSGNLARGNSSYSYDEYIYDINGDIFNVRIFPFTNNENRNEFHDLLNSLETRKILELFGIDNRGSIIRYRSNKSVVVFVNTGITDKKSYDILHNYILNEYPSLEPKKYDSQGRKIDSTGCLLPTAPANIFPDEESVNPEACLIFDCQYEIDACWRANALVSNNLSYCLNILEKDSQEVCVYQYAKQNNDSSVCKHAGDMEDYCLKWVK